MIYNDRIVGGIDKVSGEYAKNLYSSFVKGKIVLTDIETAEFVKLMENSYRDINIALANEFAMIAEDLRIDVWEAIKLANYQPRVSILNPGPGIGGHCIPIDPLFLAESSARCTMINTAREINDYMPVHVIHKVKEITKDVVKPKITIFGVAYKGNVDDTRETPALKIIKLAERGGFKLSIYDPRVTHFEYPLSNLDEATAGTDCVVVLTDHDEFRHLDYEELLNNARHKNILDTRNIIAPAKNLNIITLGNAKERF